MIRRKNITYLRTVCFCVMRDFFVQVDDVEEEVRDLRKQQRELRRKHPGRRRFLGLF